MGNRNKDIEKLFEQKNLLECKIKMIKQVIADLEKLKQDEFVYCFVDFNPYKDERLVESELGMIPEGWKVGTFTDLLKKYKQKTENINLDKVLETSYQFSHYVYYAWKSKYGQGITNGFENEPIYPKENQTADKVCDNCCNPLVHICKNNKHHSQNRRA